MDWGNPPLFRWSEKKGYAAVLSFCIGAMPPMPILGVLGATPKSAVSVGNSVGNKKRAYSRFRCKPLNLLGVPKGI